MKYMLLVLALVSAPLSAQSSEKNTVAEADLGIQSLVSKGDLPNVRQTLQAYAYLTDRAGISGSVWDESHYVSAAAGPFVDLKQWSGNNALSLGFMAGAEHFDGKTKARYALDLFVGNDNTYAEGYGETGSTHEKWFRLDANWQATEVLGLGVFGQTDDGIGPRLRLGLPEGRIKVWAAHMTGSTKFLVGADLVFQKKAD